MKKQILKIAGVKSEKEFYEKFPTEEAFMAKHGGAFKKAQMGETLSKVSSAKKGKDIPKYQDSGKPLKYNVTPPSFKYNFNAPQFQQYKPMGLPDSRSEDIVSPSAYDITGVNRYYGNLPSNPTVEETDLNKDLSNLQQGVQMTSIMGQNFQKVKAAIERKKQAKLLSSISPIVAQAAQTRPEQAERKYLRPEQIVNTGEEFFPIYGVGTNVLAKNGASVGGGEIMNTFAPNTLYDDLGYEPMNESQRYKQFEEGGSIPVELIKEGVNMAGDLTAGIIGIGTQKYIKKSQQELGKAAFQQGIQNLQGQYQSYMKDGGMTTSPYEWVSHTWQPQVIASFGDYKVKDLLKPPADADMLRAGGHLKKYTPPSAAAMSTERPDFAMGGELQTHWGGYAEPMSYNPYMPGTGETVIFKGDTPEEGSHDQVSKTVDNGETGIGMTYGGNLIEVEKGEPMYEMEEGGEIDPQTGEPKKSGVVLGNIKITKGLATLLGDPKAEGMRFKTYGAYLSEQENKQNKLIEKSLDELDNLDVQTSFDKLALGTLEAKIKGGNDNLKDYADKKMNAAALQSAVHDTKEQGLLKITDKGNIMAKLGKTIPKAQTGAKTLAKLEAMQTVPKQTRTGKYYGGITDEKVAQMKANNPWYNWEGFDPTNPSDVEDFQKAFNAKAQEQGVASRLKVDKLLGQQTASAKGLYQYQDLPPITITGKKKAAVPPVQAAPVEDVAITPYKRSVLIDIMNQALPYIRPSDREDLDFSQLSGELFALATNQLEPVKAQLLQPQLSVPYDISLQDILNENQASFRAQQRLFGYTPSLQSQLAAGKYAANQRVLGEQFRMNQAMKNQVYKENRDILNQAQLQNLAVLDQQYQRQAEAASKTKATTQAALNSIASKYAQNRLENRTLQVYENLFNYRYDRGFRTINENPLWQPNVQANSLAVKNGGKVSKKSLNGSIVKALKNI